jgi:hypothetical protein
MWADRRRRRDAGLSATAQLQALITSLSGFWWDKRTGITIATGVSAWVDRVGAKSITQATGSKQPAYDATTGVTGDGVDDFLSGASGILNGAAGFTYVIDGSASSGTYWLSYGLNICAMYVSTQLRCFMDAGANVNEWSSALTTPWTHAVYASSGQWSDGVTGQKNVYKDGVSSGSRTTSQDMSGGSFGSNTINLFAGSSGGVSVSNLSARHVIVIPSQQPLATITQIGTLLHSIEGY